MEQKKYFKEYLSKPNPDNRPLLNFYFEIRYSRVNDDRRCLYSTKQILEYDCANLKRTLPRRAEFEKNPCD